MPDPDGMTQPPVILICDCAECYETRNPTAGQTGPPRWINGKFTGIAYRLCRRCEREMIRIVGNTTSPLCERCGGYTVLE